MHVNCKNCTNCINTICMHNVSVLHQNEGVLYPYTAERRDVLENTLPEAQEISQGWGFCTPRPERLPEGEARGQSRGPRGAKSPPEGNLEGRGGCIFQCIPTFQKNILRPVVHKRSVTIQRHRQSGNLKVRPTDHPTKQLPRVGAKDAYASKNAF